VNSRETFELGVTIAKLCAITSAPGWERDSSPDELPSASGARAIGRVQWTDAFKFAQRVDRIVPHLPAPVPSANPGGHVCLTWEASGRQVDLELRQSLIEAPYVWTTTRDGMRAEHTARDLRDVVESIRATFGETDEARKETTHAAGAA
jgi:hypothetical protein